MDSLKVQIIIILLQLWIYSSHSTIKFGDLKCAVFQPDVMSLEECRIKAVNRTFNYINIKCSLHKPISEFQIHFKLLKRERGGWHPFLYDLKIDMCEFFKRPYKFMVYNLLYQYGQKFTSINHTCPYLPNEELALMNWSLSENEIFNKFPLEKGIYAAHSTFYTNKKKLIEMNGTGVYD